IRTKLIECAERGGKAVQIAFDGLSDRKFRKIEWGSFVFVSAIFLPVNAIERIRSGNKVQGKSEKEISHCFNRTPGGNVAQSAPFKGSAALCETIFDRADEDAIDRIDPGNFEILGASDKIRVGRSIRSHRLNDATLWVKSRK